MFDLQSQSLKLTGISGNKVNRNFRHLSKRDHIQLVPDCGHAATDKRSHAWIRKIEHTELGGGRNSQKRKYRLRALLCLALVAELAHFRLPIVNTY